MGYSMDGLDWKSLITRYGLEGLVFITILIILIAGLSPLFYNSLETPRVGTDFQTFVSETEDLISWLAENDSDEAVVHYLGTGPEAQQNLDQYRESLTTRGFRVKQHNNILVIKWGKD